MALRERGDGARLEGGRREEGREVAVRTTCTAAYVDTMRHATAATDNATRHVTRQCDDRQTR